MQKLKPGLVIFMLSGADISRFHSHSLRAYTLWTLLNNSNSIMLSPTSSNHIFHCQFNAQLMALTVAACGNPTSNFECS